MTYVGPMDLTDHEKRLKKLRIRCWRRGTKEMDLLFGQFADGTLDELSPSDLDSFERLMDENDQDLYLWISGASAVPEAFRPAVQLVRDFHKIV